MMSGGSTHERAEFRLRVVEGRGLFGGDVGGSSDPYVVVKLKGLGHLFSSEKQKSGVVWNNANPIWNQDFVLHPTKPVDVILIQVYDRDK
jgi:Ca2+-dependent lipid-binding protein